ncbi:hypothetical protein BGW38_005663, partial [Lunasporangiospora selenospora]
MSRASDTKVAGNHTVAGPSMLPKNGSTVTKHIELDWRYLSTDAYSSGDSSSQWEEDADDAYDVPDNVVEDLQIRDPTQVDLIPAAVDVAATATAPAANVVSNNNNSGSSKKAHATTAALDRSLQGHPHPHSHVKDASPGSNASSRIKRRSTGRLTSERLSSIRASIRPSSQSAANTSQEEMTPTPPARLEKRASGSLRRTKTRFRIEDQPQDETPSSSESSVKLEGEVKALKARIQELEMERTGRSLKNLTIITPQPPSSPHSPVYQNGEETSPSRSERLQGLLQRSRTSASTLLDSPSRQRPPLAATSRSTTTRERPPKPSDQSYSPTSTGSSPARATLPPSSPITAQMSTHHINLLRTALRSYERAALPVSVSSIGSGSTTLAMSKVVTSTISMNETLRAWVRANIDLADSASMNILLRTSDEQIRSLTKVLLDLASSSSALSGATDRSSVHLETVPSPHPRSPIHPTQVQRIGQGSSTSRMTQSYASDFSNDRHLSLDGHAVSRRLPSGTFLSQEIEILPERPVQPRLQHGRSSGPLLQLQQQQQQLSRLGSPRSLQPHATSRFASNGSEALVERPQRRLEARNNSSQHFSRHSLPLDRLGLDQPQLQHVMYDHRLEVHSEGELSLQPRTRAGVLEHYGHERAVFSEHEDGHGHGHNLNEVVEWGAASLERLPRPSFMARRAHPHQQQLLLPEDLEHEQQILQQQQQEQQQQHEFELAMEHGYEQPMLAQEHPHEQAFQHGHVYEQRLHEQEYPGQHVPSLRMPPSEHHHHHRSSKQQQYFLQHQQDMMMTTPAMPSPTSSPSSSSRVEAPSMISSNN